MSAQKSNAERAATDVETGIGRGIGIGASAAVLFLLLRLLAVSDWNWSTAAQIMAVTDADGALTMFFGTLMADPAFTGVLVGLGLPVAVLHLVWPIDRKRQVTDTALAVALLAASTIALCTSFRYFWVPIIAVLVGAVIVAARLSWRHGRGRAAVEFVFRRAWLLTALALLMLAAVVTTPWVPEETIETHDGTVHGYVIKTEPGFLTVLTEPGRTVRVLISSTVIRRD
jgi:hypothetical protein